MAQFLIDPGQRGLITIPRPFRSEAGTADLLLAVGLVRSAETLTSDLFVVSELEATILNESLLPSTGVYAEFGPAVAAEMLAFESNDGGDREIFMISRRRTFDVSNHRSADWAPVWSPDGRSLAFQSFRGGRSGIYQCAPRRAAHIHAVAVDAAGNCWGAAWSPRSDQIAFVSDAEGAPAVYVVDVDGSDRRRITPAGISADLPSWRPIP
jgi:Tol biopolymer transport system component